MPAKSVKQQEFFGLVDKYKKGELKNPSKEIKKAAEGMTKKQVKDFASTKHKGLPEKVGENVVRLKETDLRRIVRECVTRILKESDNLDDYEYFYREQFPPGKQGDIDYSYYMKDRSNHITKDIDPRFNDPESRVHPYSEYFDSPSEYGMDRLHTLDRMNKKDSFGDYAPGDRAYYADGSTFPSADYADGTDFYKYKK